MFTAQLANSVPVMNLFALDACPDEDLLHGCRVGHGVAGVGIEGLDQDAHASISEPRLDELSCVVRRQEAGFDADPASDQQLAQFDDPVFSLVRCDEFRQDRPTGYQRHTPPRVRFYWGRCAQGDRHSGASAPNGVHRRGARGGGERLTPVIVEGVHVNYICARLDSRASLLGELPWRPRHTRMVP
jgi:hypothetical protein